MNKSLFTLLLFASVWAPVSYAADASNGEQLYQDVAIERVIRGEQYTDANCETCHSSAVYTRDNRRVNTFARLVAQVEMCNTMLDVGWFPDEVTDVASYLNEKFYKLKK